MSIKKTVMITVFVSAIFVGVNFMVAQAYEPLVRLPGLPATGDINLSQYIVGLYNFLLSIVGIVAVMMLIIGGMKYITAAGNASTIGDAKDTIWNAIFGLLLALLSWVIVSTINPDVLYIKAPALVDSYRGDLGACGIFDSTAVAPAPNCTCKEDIIPPITFVGKADEDDCDIACADNCNLTEPLTCIKAGSSEKPIIDEVGDWWCYCVDDAHVTSIAPAGTGCNDVCQTPAFVVGGEYHCLVADAKIGFSTVYEPDIEGWGGPFAALHPTQEELDLIRKTAMFVDAFNEPVYYIDESETCVFVYDGGFSVSANPIAQWEWDIFLPIDGLTFDWIGQEWIVVSCRDDYGGFWNAIDVAPAANTLCNKNTINESHPEAWVCDMNFRITDSAGNVSTDRFKLGIEKP